MGYSKGQSGNPHGRPKGSTNRTTRAVREVLRGILESELEGLPERLAGMPDAERVAVVVKLLPYVLPRLESTSDNKEMIDDKFSFFNAAL